MKNLYLRIFLLCFLLTGIQCFAQTTTYLWVGKSAPADATHLLLGTKVSDIKWTSSSYFELSGNNYKKDVKITQYFSGSADVICSWKENGKSQSQKWTFACYSNDVSISRTTLTLNVGETYRLSYQHKVDNDYVRYANVSFFSSNSACVEVNNEGYVTAISPGTADVTLYSAISQPKPYCRVTVIGDDPTPPTPVINPEKISFEKSSISIAKGFATQQIVSVIPANSTAKVTYSSSDNSIVIVDANTGFVKGLKQGEVTITATTSNNLTCSYRVIVKESVANITMPMVAPLANKLNKIIENTMNFKK